MRLVPGRRRCIKPRITMTPRLRPSRIALGPSNHSRDRPRRLSTISSLECSISTLPPIPERSRRGSGPASGLPPTWRPERTAPHTGWYGIWCPPLAIDSILWASSTLIAAVRFMNDVAWSHAGGSPGERAPFIARRGARVRRNPSRAVSVPLARSEAASCSREGRMCLPSNPDPRLGGAAGGTASPALRGRPRGENRLPRPIRRFGGPQLTAGRNMV